MILKVAECSKYLSGMNMKFFSTLFFLIFLACSLHAQGTWQSDLVFYDDNNKLVYKSDQYGNRIPDFSYAGYRNSELQIPSVPIVKEIEPVAGDNTTHIQNALFEVAIMPADSSGIRGALLLKAGEYEVRGTIKLNFDGVIIRGVGDGNDPLSNTIIKATGNSPSKRSVLVAGGGGTSKWADSESGSQTNIISDTVFIGERKFRVANPSLYNVGDNIIIVHPCTNEWLAAIDYGGTFSDSIGAEPGVDLPWAEGSQKLVFNRYIRAINGDTITIDAPVFNHLVRSLSQSYIYKYARLNIKTQVGIENLRIDIVTNGGTDENHAWNAIDLYQIEDSWVRDCTVLHFGLSGFRSNTASRITIENCQALDPVATITGGNMYNFNIYTASQQILFKNCHAANGRHHYVSNGTSWTSGCVFLNCTSSGAYASSEGHRQWSMGLLYDNHTELDGPRAGLNPRLLGLYNRGFFGTSHGWSSAHSVAWACDMANGDLVVQQPPTAQNYAIGCFGARVTGVRPPASFPAPDGYIEGVNQAGLLPGSLFLAQLEDRLGPAVSIVSDEIITIPETAELYQNFPNPFNPQTTIAYSVSQPGNVKLTIYDIAGRKIELLVDEFKSQGTYSVAWLPQHQASGVYFYKLTSGRTVSIKKMMLIK